VKTITIKVHEFQDEALERAAKAEQISKSEVVRRSLVHYLSGGPKSQKKKKPSSVLDRLEKYLPKGGSGLGDLASNPRHLRGYGRD
jgi:Ribbon-helix-helix protein, copG family